MGLTMKHSDSSTGTNLMLGKFTLAHGEVWDDTDYQNGEWDVCPTNVYAPDGPEPIYLCASINPNGTINETTDLDNTLRSEVQVPIKATGCP